MIQTFTHNDLIRYAYNETTEEENQQIEEALTQEPDMLNYYLNVLDLQCALSADKMEPSKRTVQNILSYSANHQLSQIRRN
ncbi:MAG: hypothetical protein V4683_18245 [Bacteroidota bacterium]